MNYRTSTPFFIVTSIVFALSLGACRTTPNASNGGSDSTSNGGSAKTSTIDGIVLRGPISPVDRPGVPNTAPLAGAPVSISQDNSSAQPVQIASDSSGKFVVKVAAGTYTVTPMPFEHSPLPRPGDPVRVQVSANATAQVTLQYDTGIR